MAYRAGDYDTAMALYRQNLGAFQNDPAIQGLVLSSLAYCQEAKEAYAGAAQYFDQILQSDRFLMQDDALFGLARVYEGMGEKEKRLAMLDRLVADHKDSIYHAVARETAAGLN
jgi:tetratricopeptide (TPR) repeat protein